MKIIKVADPAPEAARLRKANAIQDLLMEDTKAIMKSVAEHGDSAVLDYTAKFDGVRLDSIVVTEQEMKQAYSQVTKEQVRIVRAMKVQLAKRDGSTEAAERDRDII